MFAQIYISFFLCCSSKLHSELGIVPPLLLGVIAVSDIRLALPRGSTTFIRRRFNVDTTLFGRQQRRSNVETTSCAYWDRVCSEKRYTLTTLYLLAVL